MIALLTLLGVAAGCGSDLPRAAEPADSPPLTAAPAGRQFGVGEMPEGVVADPVTGLVAVATRDPDRLVLLDSESGSIRHRVRLPAAARHLGLAAPGGPILVPAERADQLIYVSLRGGRTRAVEVGAHPHDATQANGRTFIADEFGDSVTVVHGGQVTGALGAPLQPGGIAAGGGYVGLIAVRERVLTTYGAGSGRRLGTVDAGAGPTHIETCGRRAFVADTQGDSVLEFRLGPSTIRTGSAPAPGTPYGITADCRRRTVWVTLTGRNRVNAYTITPSGLRPGKSYPTVRQPNSIAVDPRSGDLFITASSGSVLERIGPGTGR